MLVEKIVADGIYFHCIVFQCLAILDVLFADVCHCLSKIHHDIILGRYRSTCDELAMFPWHGVQGERVLVSANNQVAILLGAADLDDVHGVVLSMAAAGSTVTMSHPMMHQPVCSVTVSTM